MKTFPWSHSALTAFKTCPRQYSEIKVYKRVVEEPGDAATRGNYIHAEIEKYFKTREPMPPDVAAYSTQIHAALDWTGGDRVFIGPVSRLILVEHKMALNSKLKRCDWVAPDVWSRSIADLLVVEGNEAWVIDWKTGKVKPDSKQLQLFALFVFYHFPKVKTCHTSFEWLKHNQNTRETFSVVDAQTLWGGFIPSLREFKDAFATELWPERPSGLCNGWCPVESCRHWKPKK